MHPTASAGVMIGVASVAIGVAIGIALLHGRQARAAGASPWPFALGLAAWMALTAGLAATGLFLRWSPPPPFLVLGVTSIAATIVSSRSSIGRRLATLPLWTLVAIASFRLPLELVMHAAAAEGTMPPQMTFGAGGWNYDILSGIGAIVVALLLRASLVGPTLVRAWNVMGLALLTIIVGIAIVSTPPIAAFGPARLNTWIAYAPFVWMIAVNVPAALLVHLVVFRALAAVPVGSALGGALQIGGVRLEDGREVG